MDAFIRRQNIEHYKRLFKTAADEKQRERILQLLEEEQQKQKNAGDKDNI
jgi:hypothetical protein